MTCESQSTPVAEERLAKIQELCSQGDFLRAHLKIHALVLDCDRPVVLELPVSEIGFQELDHLRRSGRLLRAVLGFTLQFEEIRSTTWYLPAPKIDVYAVTTRDDSLLSPPVMAEEE